LEVSDEQVELLREMRDLLRVMAEPALAQRDQKLRSALIEVVGKGKAKAKAALLMDGSRTQSSVGKESGMDPGNLSRFVKSLRAKELIGADERHPKLALSVPPNFFEKADENNG
jgi:hypothetical protein